LATLNQESEEAARLATCRPNFFTAMLHCIDVNDTTTTNRLKEVGFQAGQAAQNAIALPAAAT